MTNVFNHDIPLAVVLTPQRDHATAFPATCDGKSVSERWRHLIAYAVVGLVGPSDPAMWAYVRVEDRS